MNMLLCLESLVKTAQQIVCAAGTSAAAYLECAMGHLCHACVAGNMLTYFSMAWSAANQSGLIKICCLQLVTQRLSLVMLLAIEVAVEFWLSLKFTPQAQLLSELQAHTSVAKEVTSDICMLQCPSAATW